MMTIRAGRKSRARLRKFGRGGGFAFIAPRLDLRRDGAEPHQRLLQRGRDLYRHLVGRPTRGRDPDLTVSCALWDERASCAAEPLRRGDWDVSMLSLRDYKRDEHPAVEVHVPVPLTEWSAAPPGRARPREVAEIDF